VKPLAERWAGIDSSPIAAALRVELDLRRRLRGGAGLKFTAAPAGFVFFARRFFGAGFAFSGFAFFRWRFFGAGFFPFFAARFAASLARPLASTARISALVRLAIVGSFSEQIKSGGIVAGWRRGLLVYRDVKSLRHGSGRICGDYLRVIVIDDQRPRNGQSGPPGPFGIVQQIRWRSPGTVWPLDKTGRTHLRVHLGGGGLLEGLACEKHSRRLCRTGMSVNALMPDALSTI